MESIVLGSGCYWCSEAAFSIVKGVENVNPGYAGGRSEDANYETVSGGQTNHAEVVKIEFQTSIITLEDILNIFWIIHDPTTLNRQQHDVGRQYRSAIFYANSAQYSIAEQSIKAAQKLYSEPITTTLEALEGFYPAEENMHNYYLNHPDQAYCQIIINPKLTKLRQNYANKLKKSINN